MKNLTLARGRVNGQLTYHFEETRRFPNDINRHMIDASELPSDPELLLSIANITKAIIRAFANDPKAFTIINMAIEHAVTAHSRGIDNVCPVYASQLSEHDARKLKIMVEYSPGFRKMLNGVHSTIKAQQIGLNSVTAVVIPFAFAKKYGGFSETIDKIDELAEQTIVGDRWDNRTLSHWVKRLLKFLKKTAPSTLDYKRMRLEVNHYFETEPTQDKWAGVLAEADANLKYRAPHPDAGCGTLFTPDTIRSDKRAGPTDDQRSEVIDLSLARFIFTVAKMDFSPIETNRENKSILNLWKRDDKKFGQWLDRIKGKAKKHCAAPEIHTYHARYADLILRSAFSGNFGTNSVCSVKDEVTKLLELFSLAQQKAVALHRAKNRLELYARGEIKPNLKHSNLIDLVPNNQGENRDERALRVTNVTFIERELFGTKVEQENSIVSRNNLLLLALHMDVNPADLWLEFRYIHPACEFMRVLGNMSRGHDSVMTPDMANAYLIYRSYIAAGAMNHHTDYWHLVQLWWLETFPKFPEIQQQFEEQCKQVVIINKSAGIGVRTWGIPFLKLDAAEEARALNRTIL